MLRHGSESDQTEERETHKTREGIPLNNQWQYAVRWLLCRLSRIWKANLQGNSLLVRTILLHDTNLGNCLYGRPVFQKQLHHLDSVLLTGDVQRSETILTNRKQESFKRVERSRKARGWQIWIAEWKTQYDTKAPSFHFPCVSFLHFYLQTVYKQTRHMWKELTAANRKGMSNWKRYFSLEYNSLLSPTQLPPSLLSWLWGFWLDPMTSFFSPRGFFSGSFSQTIKSHFSNHTQTSPITEHTLTSKTLAGPIICFLHQHLLCFLMCPCFINDFCLCCKQTNIWYGLNKAHMYSLELM